MKKILAVILCTMLVSAIPVAAEEDPAADAAELLENVRGTYDELFAVTNAEEYDQIWLDNCAAAAGEEMAPQIAEALKTACAGTQHPDHHDRQKRCHGRVFERSPEDERDVPGQSGYSSPERRHASRLCQRVCREAPV